MSLTPPHKDNDVVEVVISPEERARLEEIENIKKDESRSFPILKYCLIIFVFVITILVGMFMG